MQSLRQFVSRFRKKPQHPTQPLQTLSSALELARRAQYQEEYQTALDLLNESETQAKIDHNTRIEVDIILSRVDILIAQKDYVTAEQLLQDLRTSNQAKHFIAPLAYTLASIGVIAQALGDWEKARDYYEQARKTAQDIRTDGAGGRATAHLADVYLHEGNASYAIYLLQDALPRLNRSGDRELMGYFMGQLGLALISSGQVKQGIDQIKQGLDHALTLKHRAHVRSLSLLLGKTLFEQGHYAEAKTPIENVLSLINDQGQPYIEHIEALTILSQILLKLGDYENSLAHANHAKELAEEQGDENQRHHIGATLGMIYATKGDAQAIPYLQEAIEYFPSDDDFSIELLRHLARIHAHLGAVNEAESSYKQAINQAKSETLALAHVKSELGRHYSQNNQLKEALLTWQSALQDYQAIRQNDPVTRLYCDIATLYTRIGDGRLAVREYGEALLHLSTINDLGTRGVVLANVANGYSEYGDLDSAQDYFQEAISIAQKLETLREESIRRGNYGRLLAQLGKFAEAHKQLEQALAISAKQGDNLLIAIQTANRALCYSLEGNYGRAESLYQEAVAHLDATNHSDWYEITHAHYADTLVLLGQIEPAHAIYEKVYQEAKNNHHIMAQIHGAIGLIEINLKTGNVDEASSLINEIDSIAKRAYFRRYILRLYQAQHQIYQQRGDQKQANIMKEEVNKLIVMMQIPQNQHK